MHGDVLQLCMLSFPFLLGSLQANARFSVSGSVAVAMRGHEEK
jgi:hypothetical protein